MIDRIEKASRYIKKHIKETPDIAVVLGSGLGGFAETFGKKLVIPFEEIPYFPASGVSGHKGELIFVKLFSKNVLLMCGRPHYYEGYTMQETVYPVRIFGSLGVKTLILTAAVGAVNRKYKTGDIVVLKDFINMMGDNPLRGRHSKQFGEMFPDMSEPFDRNLSSAALKAAKKYGIKAHEGVYLATTGPSYETKAEIKAFAKMGADVVGMSVVPETIAANQMNIRTVGICNVSNLAAGVSKNRLSHEEVLKAGLRSQEKFSKVIEELIKRA